MKKYYGIHYVLVSAQSWDKTRYFIVVAKNPLDAIKKLEVAVKEVVIVYEVTLIEKE